MLHKLLTAIRGTTKEATTMIELGQKAKDKVTGFEDIIVGRIEYLTGCDQYGLAPPAKDGKTNDTQWFDEGRIVITGPGVTAADVASAKPGGVNRDRPA